MFNFFAGLPSKGKDQKFVICLSSVCHRNKIKSAVDLFTMVAEYRRHIGTNKCILAPMWQPMSLIKFYKQIQLVGH